MWVAMVISLLGIGLSSLIGIKLPGLEYNNQRVEARFRKRLVYAEDDKNYADIPSLVELFSGLRLTISVYICIIHISACGRTSFFNF